MWPASLLLSGGMGHHSSGSLILPPVRSARVNGEGAGCSASLAALLVFDAGQQLAHDAEGGGHDAGGGAAVHALLQDSDLQREFNTEKRR